MIRHKRTIEQKFKAIVAMIVAMGLVSGFTLQDGTISDAHSSFNTTYDCGKDEHTHGDGNCTIDCGLEEHSHESCALEYTDLSHDHDDSCYSCGKTEHTHDETCCHKPLHAHSASCLTCTHTNTEYVQYYKAGKPWHVLRCMDCGDEDSATEHIQSLTCTDQEDGTHLAECTYPGCSYSAINSHSNLKAPVSDGKGNHIEECGICGGVAKITPCEYGSWASVGSGKHKGTCSVCNDTTEEPCTIEKYSKAADGKYKAKCPDCNAEDVLSADQGELIEKFYEFADKAENTGLDWRLPSIYTPGAIRPEIQAWKASLSAADKDELNDLYGAYLAAEEGKAKADVDKIADYVAAKYPMAEEIMAFLNPIGGIAPLGTVPAGEYVAIEPKDGTTPLPPGALYYIYKDGGTQSETCVYEVGKTKIEVKDDASASVEKTGDIIYIPKDQDICIKEKQKPGAYNGKTYASIATEMKFKYNSDGAPNQLEQRAGTELVANNTVPRSLEIKYDVETIAIELKLFNDSSAAEIPSSVTNAKYIIENAADSDDKIVWTRNIPMAICKTGKLRMDSTGVLLVPATSTIKYIIKETEAPSGYIAKAPTEFDFTPVFSPADMGINVKSDFAKNGDDVLKAKLIYKEIPSITTKFLKKGDDATALTGCSVILESATANKGSVTLEPGDTIVIGTPASSMDISKSGKVITLDSGKNIKILQGVGPLGYKNLEDITFQFQADADGKVMLSGGTTAPWVVAEDGTKGLKIYFDTAPTFKFTTSGTGHPDKTGLVITEKFGAKRSFPVASATAPETALADGEYSVTTTNAAKGYKGATGTFTISGGKVTGAAGACEKTDDTTINIKFSSDDKIDDIKVYVYPKKSKKDEPDTDKDALKGWVYTLEIYTGDEDDPTDDDKSSHWDTVEKSLKPESGKSYAILDAEDISVGKYYRLKETTAPSGYEKDSKYAYFYINSDGQVKPVEGKIDTNKDQDEILLYNDDVDEDSDDVIAIHKVNNTGSNLSGAHLQIYPYSDSNTLAYGSSSTASTNSTNSGTSTNSSTSSNSSSSTNTRTTTAKTTPAKPSVSSSDVIVDWTTGEKAQTIDIDKLEKGKNYTLREVSAPSGYETPAYDFVFKYGTDGNITIVRNYNGLLSVTGNKLVLKNLTPTEAAATRPKTGDHSRLALWLDICIVMLGGLYLSGYSIFEAFTEKKKVKVVAKKKPVNNKRKR